MSEKKSIKAYNNAIDMGYTKEFEVIACRYPRYAYYFALCIPGANIYYCQKHACRDPKFAYLFSFHISEADIYYCFEACKGTVWQKKIITPYDAYLKAINTSYSRYFEKIACKDYYYAYKFAIDIPEADINYCLEACKGTEYYAKLQEHIMEEAIG